MFLVNYIGFGGEDDSASCDVKDTRPDFVCGNAITDTRHEKGRKLFKQNCAVCHSANTERLTGPGLLGIQDRLPEPAEEWFTAWVFDNDSVLRSGDPYARKIYEENARAAMTFYKGVLSKEEVHEIYAFLTER